MLEDKSGGGTVYHDLENINFSFIQGKRDHDKDLNNEILLKALESLGFNAYASGRSDLMIEHNGPKKISGSAFKQKKDSSFHHGTMLVKTELGILNNYLVSKHADIEAKGIKSVRSSVLNLSDLKPEINTKLYMDAVKSSFLTHFSTEANAISDNTTVVLAECDIDSSAKTYATELQDWNWMFGETPRFEISRESIDGILTINLRANKGKIENIELQSDVLNPFLLNTISEFMETKELRKSLLTNISREINENYPEFNEEFKQIEVALFETGLFITN